MPSSQFISDYQKLDNPIEKVQLSKKSDAFYDESTKSFEAEVQETKSKRVAFARIEFKPENCYGAGKDSFLWRIESGQTKTDDPLYECRVALVGDRNGDKDKIDKVAAVGHPNEKGARQYFSAIKEAIEKTSPEFMPKVEDFRVASPNTRTLGDSFEIDYVVSDTGELGLKHVELWRTQEKDKWPENPIQTKPLAGENGPVSGSFTDSPSAPGKYWYGVHVVDNTGNWNDQRNSNTNGQPSNFEPVEVKNPQEGTLTLYVHEGSADGRVLSGAEVIGQDAAGGSFSQMAYANGFVVITGSPGSWQFTVTKPGYAANSWSQEITETCTKHAFLLAEQPTADSVKSNSLICTLAGHSDKVTSVAFSPGGRTLASGSDDHTIKFWDVASRTEVATLAGHSQWVKSVAFSPDGLILATGSWGEFFGYGAWHDRGRELSPASPKRAAIPQAVDGTPMPGTGPTIGRGPYRTVERALTRAETCAREPGRALRNAARASAVPHLC